MSEKDDIKNAVMELGKALKDRTNPGVAKLAGNGKPLKPTYISAVRHGHHKSRNVAYWMAIFALRKAAKLIEWAKILLNRLGEDAEIIAEDEMETVRVKESAQLKEVA